MIAAQYFMWKLQVHNKYIQYFTTQEIRGMMYLYGEPSQRWHRFL